MIRSFLMIGQSNMAGRGYLKDVKQICDEHIKMLVNGRWQMMAEPINFDRPTAGVGLAASFAGAWRLENEHEQIGLIPCAEGGASLDEWAVGEALFDNAVFHAKLAQRTSTLDGILWHQGESDSMPGRTDVYYDKLRVIVDALREALDSPSIPIIVGGIGDFLSEGRYGKYFTEYEQVNRALQKYAQDTPNTYFVTAQGLTANADGLHFDALSQRKLGIRYFEAFHHRKNVLSPISEELKLVATIQDRALTKNEKTTLLEISFARGEIALHELEEQLARLA